MLTFSTASSTWVFPMSHDNATMCVAFCHYEPFNCLQGSMPGLKPAFEPEIFLSPPPARLTSRFLPQSPLPAAMAKDDASEASAAVAEAEGEKENKEEKDKAVKSPKKRPAGSKNDKGKAALAKAKARAKGAAKASPMKKFPVQKGSPAKSVKAKSPMKSKGKPGGQGSPAKSPMKSKGKPGGQGSPAKSLKAKSPMKSKDTPGGPVKKPAAKSALRQVTAKLQEGALGQERSPSPSHGKRKAKKTEEHESSESGSELETRDFAKARKFNKMKKQGTLPKPLLDMLKKVEGEDGARQAVTKLINSVVHRDKKTGHFSLVTEGEAFQTWKSKYFLKEDKDQVEGEPKGIFLHRVFNGNQEALDKAICAGEVMVTQRNGMDYCCYPKFKHTTKQGTEDKGILKADTQLEQNQFALLSAAFNKIGHGSEEKTGRQESSSSHKSPPKKALPQKPDWSTLKPLLGEAKSAIDRLERDLMKTRERVQGSKDDNLVAQLKQLVVNNKKCKGDVDHVLSWEEFPPGCEESWTLESVNNWLLALAQKTEKLEEGFESLKAVLKARNL